MTKELFLSCVDMLFQRQDIEKFWEMWNKYPKYARQWCNANERDIAESNSQRHKEAEDWWKKVKIKLANAFGEDWVKENCIDMVEENGLIFMSMFQYWGSEITNSPYLLYKQLI